MPISVTSRVLPAVTRGTRHGAGPGERINPSVKALRSVPMELSGKVVVVTGGASGIGRSLSQAFARAGAAAVVVADVNGDGAAEVAAALGGVGTGVALDVSDDAAVGELVRQTEETHGPIDLFASNA